MDYELYVNDEAEGVFAVSLVESPAIERDFVAFSKEQKTIKFNSEKRIVTGPALIPNQKIYRNSKDKGEHYVQMSSETIEKVVQKFAKKGYFGETTLEHQKKLENNYVFESWITREPLAEFNVPKGTWMISMKIEDNETWDAIKSGQVKGFSIEGLFSKLMKNEDVFESYKKTKKMSLYNKLKSLLDEFSAEEIEEQETPTEDEEKKDKQEYHQLLNGEQVFISEEGYIFTVNSENVPLSHLSAGSYTLLDETVLTVDEYGKITGRVNKEQRVKDKEEEEDTETVEKQDDVEKKEDYMNIIKTKDGLEIEVNEDMMVVSEGVEDGEYQLEDGTFVIIEGGKVVEHAVRFSKHINELKEEVSKLSKSLEDKDKEIEEMKSELENKDKEIEKLSAEPATTKVEEGKSEMDFSKMTAAQRMAESIRRMNAKK